MKIRTTIRSIIKFFKQTNKEIEAVREHVRIIHVTKNMVRMAEIGLHHNIIHLYYK